MGSHRRIGAALVGVVLVALASAVVVRAPAASAQPDSEWVHYRRIDVDGPAGSERVLVTLPRRSDRAMHPPGERYPILIALHGRGEALQGPDRGFLGWAVRYSMPEGFRALLRGRLGMSDYRGLVREPHLEYVNQVLRSESFRGMLVVTPYVPDLGGEELGSARMTEYADWLAGPLVDAVRGRFESAARGRDGVGIDGVSLGGRVALEAGFRHPEAFGAVGALQPAIRGHEDALAELALGAAREQPQHLRLLTSDEDPFLWATRRLSMGLRDRQVRHTFAAMPGPHDYSFNRGPGVLEMLLFHDRALAREPLPEP